MPPYKRQYRRRQYKRRPMTRGAIYGRAASQLVSDVKKLKNLINVEFKYHDVHANQAAHTTGGIIPLNYVNQGDGATSRDGDQFRMKSLDMTFNVSLPSSAVRPNNTRMLLVLDTEPNGVLPLVTDVIDTASGATYINAPRNLANRSRFVIMKDWLVTLNPNGTEATSRKYFRKIDIKVLYNGATATILTLKNNGLFLLVLGDEAVAATNPVYDISSRIRFIDN